KAYGMVLACGPTGSGKTTTLYAMLTVLNRQEVNIVTIEDPIEFGIPNVNQTQINPDAGITFATGLRALVRQDPNVIMVGEIRDKETAEISVHSALTGSLVLSTLHTNDAATAVPRMFDIGVAPFLVAAVVNLIIGQRLVRRICLDCIESYAPDAATEKAIAHQFAVMGIPDEDRPPKILYRGRGCEQCGHIGYRGRFGIYELLEITESVRRLIVSENFSLDALRKLARDAGMVTMFEDGLRKVERGMTTIEEVFRVVRE
ncbi:MAG: type II/IV secretion system protein, partial [Candidatus Harrisonbacteria bacterium]|nr:type II/IV secretion system protein [Candidatus Harrisonbacteria bacterium]